MEPGKSWEHAAGDIFLANWEQPLWGWADHRSTWLLDFWLQFDPQTRFLFVHTSAADTLVAAAAAHPQHEAFDAHQVLDRWCAYQAQMLEFSLRHQDRCAWFTHRTLASDEAANQPSLMLPWSLPFSSPVSRPNLSADTDPSSAQLLHAFAMQAVQQHAQALALQQELWATLPGSDGHDVTAKPQAEALAAAEVFEQIRSVVVLQHGATRQQLALTQQEVIAITLNNAELQQHIAAETKARKEAAEKAELLLAQLHQAELQAETKAKQTEAQAKVEALKQRDTLSQEKANFIAARDALAQEKAKLTQRLEAQTAAQQTESQAKAQLQAKLDTEIKARKETAEEADLLLAQLHQVQEELEALFLKNQEAQQQQHQALEHAKTQLQAETKAKQTEAQAKAEALKQRDALSQEKSSLIAARDALAQEKAKLTQRLEAQTAAQQAESKAKTQLQAKLDAETKARKEAAEEADLLLAQLHQVQEELEALFLKNQEAQQQQHQALEHAKTQLQAETKAKQTEAQAKAEALKQRDALSQEKSSLIAARDALAQEKAKLTQRLEAQTAAQQAESKAKTQLQAKLDAETKARKEAAEEADLLLAQLHQVQEELENYFLQHQAAQAECEALRARLARWAGRFPNQCAWESLQTQASVDPDAQEIVLLQTEYGDRLFPELRLKLHAAKNRLQLTLMRPAGGAAPWLKWPQFERPDGQWQAADELLIDPAARKGSAEAANLAALAPSDLKLLVALCESLGAQDATHWASQWQAMAQALRALPPRWRYDAIRLREEQQLPQYEHLWLRLDNAQWGDRHWPAFEFVLSSHQPRSAKGSHLPKLEFPLSAEGTPKQFDNWFAESEDHKGPKFELRFETLAPAMDMSCWNALSKTDQGQAMQIAIALPQMLQELQQAGVGVSHPWSDWQTLAKSIQVTLVTCLGLDVKALPRAKTPAAV